MLTINSHLKKLPLYIALLFVGFSLALGSSLLAPSAAYADGWPVIGGDNGTDPGPGAQNPIDNVGGKPLTPGPNPGAGPGGPGSGEIGHGNPNLVVEWYVGASCGSKVIDGKTYYGTPRQFYAITKVLMGNSTVDDSEHPPNYGKDWYIFDINSAGQITWIGKVAKGPQECIYPTVNITRADQTCSIYAQIQVRMTSPKRKDEPVVTAYTPYREGSKDWNSCASSRSRAFVASTSKAITEYGYYELHGKERYVNMNKKITSVTNPVTGAVTRTEEITLGTPYTPRGWHLINTLSMDCKNGARTPGVMQNDWTEAPCQGTGSGKSHVCKADPIQYDTSDGTGTSMTSVGTKKIQFLRDGKARKMVFNQSIVGPTVTVNSYKTKFLRSSDSTPWDSSKAYNKNLFSLTKDGSTNNILNAGNGTSSPTYSGRANTVFAQGYYASEQNAPTKITQQINWTGTRTIQSVKIDGMSSNGQIMLSKITVKVPTSGVCTNTGTIDYVRAIGHEAG